MTATTATIRAAIAPIVAAHDLDLIDVGIVRAGRRSRVKVVVDTKGGVDVAACQAVAREISRLLDDVDPVPGGYTLEVTSPGVHHPLTDQRSFDRVEGREVVVTVRSVGADGSAGGSELRGVVGAARTDSVEIATAEGPRTVRYDEILRATQVLPW